MRTAQRGNGWRVRGINMGKGVGVRGWRWVRWKGVVSWAEEAVGEGNGVVGDGVMGKGWWVRRKGVKRWWVRGKGWWVSAHRVRAGG